MTHSTRYFAMAVIVATSVFSSAGQAADPTLEWIRQLGTSEQDESEGVSADGLGNVYITGWTQGSLGETNAGDGDAFVAKYDASGALQWTEQLGTSEFDVGESVSADGLGNVYISGWTRGSLGGPYAGGDPWGGDAFVSKYDASGTLQWIRQLGTSSDDYSYGVLADGRGNVYISGSTGGSLGGPNAGGNDAFLSKYDASGALQWTEQLGTSESESSRSVSTDGLGNVYISGTTYGSLGGTTTGPRDVFVSKYDASGTLEWTRQLGTSNDDFHGGVSADGLGNVYISGSTGGSLGGPHSGRFDDVDAFVAKYDASGTLTWTRQLGTGVYDTFRGVLADGRGNVYISGFTSGNLGGPNAGEWDALLSKYDASGTLQWTEQLGTSDYDYSLGVSADGLGNVYISGVTKGSLGGPFAGGFSDAFVAKFVDLPDLAGDFNSDGICNGADFLMWQRGESDDPLSGSDLAEWEANYGIPVSGNSQHAPIPEPGTALLLVVGAMSLCAGGRVAFTTLEQCGIRLHRREPSRKSASGVLHHCQWI